MKKALTILGGVVVITVAVCVTWWHVSTKDIRAYKKRNETLKLVHERQALELAIVKQNVQIAQLKAAKTPVEMPSSPKDVNEGGGT